MINIAFFVPYPELLEAVKRVIAPHNLNPKGEVNISLFVMDVGSVIPKKNCDVMIARGLQVWDVQERNKAIPIVELPITTCDIIRAVQECKKIMPAKKIAILGPDFSDEDIAVLETVLSCSMKKYPFGNRKYAEREVRRAINDGCDAIIGGYTVKNFADRFNQFAVVIVAGERAILNALNEAIKVANVMRQERERSQIFSIISNSSKDGILYISQDNIVLTANPASMSILEKNPNKIIGRSVEQISSEMYKNVDTVRKEQREISDHLYKHGKYVLSVNYLPVMIHESIAGVVITFQDITRIQQMENHIRQKMSEKGLNAKYRFNDIIHKSQSINNLINLARRYAVTSSNIVIEGETGTGKELLAQSIHNASLRHDAPFVAINCAAIPESLLESEMFGYEEGSFTGSSKGGKAGLFELAHNGTMFLDEVSELPLNLQGKLLRVLQEREVRRVGSTKVKSVDVRIIAASNYNLKSLVSRGQFRKDLFYRLDVLNLFIPSLSERPEDIKVLFNYFIRQFNESINMPIPEAEEDALLLLCKHRFEGNVRELRNIAERINILCCESGKISKADIQTALCDHQIDASSFPGETETHAIRASMKKNERELILQALKRCANNQTHAAQVLGIDRTTLWRKLHKYNLYPKKLAD